jgi:hypothetical protein
MRLARPATTGVPLAMASSGVGPKVSKREQVTKTRARRKRAVTCSAEAGPGVCTISQSLLSRMRAESSLWDLHNEYVGKGGRSASPEGFK